MNLIWVYLIATVIACFVGCIIGYICDCLMTLVL